MLENAPTDVTNEISDKVNEAADIQSTAPKDNANDKINEYQSSAKGEGLEAPTMPEDTVSESLASEPKDAAVQEYAITFLQGGGVVLDGDNFHAEYRLDGTVTHYVKPQQDLSRAKTENGELYRVRLESNYLYIFEDDLQTAECYKLV